jgi:uncharacterized OsmC-like protein
MRITLLSDNAVRVEPIGSAITIESPSPEQEYSAFHMLAGSLAYCSLSVMYMWAEQAGLQTSDLVVDVAWTFTDNPHRVGAFDLRFAWPSLPAERLEAAKRAAATCAVHATLEYPPRITVDGTVATPSREPPAPS